MRRTERVAHKQAVAERRQLTGESFVVGLFFRVVADVFEQQHAAICERAALCLAHPRQRSPPRTPPAHPSNSASFAATGRKLYFGSGLPLGRPKMRCQHQAGAAFARKCQRWQRLPDARIVGDTPAVQWNIKIHANEYSFAANSRSRIESLFMVCVRKVRGIPHPASVGFAMKVEITFSAICEAAAHKWPASAAPRASTCLRGHESRFTNHDPTASTPIARSNPGSGSNTPTRCRTTPIFSRSSCPPRACSRNRRWTSAGCP